MADVNVINVTSLTPIVAAAIVSGQQVTIYDQGGIAYRAPIEDLVSAAQALNGCLCVQTKTVMIASADILTGTTVFFDVTPPIGYYIKPISIDFKGVYNSATYGGATTVSFTVFGAGQNVCTANILGFTIDTFVPLALSTATTDTTYKDGVDVYVTIPPGATTGDSDVSFVLTYMTLPTP
jgi:hypothetical protein